MADEIQKEIEDLQKLLTTGGTGIPPYNQHYIDALQSSQEFIFSGKNVDTKGFAMEKQFLTDLSGALNSNLFPQKNSAAQQALGRIQEAVGNTEKSNQLFDVARAIYQCQQGNGGDQHLTPYKDSLDRAAHAFADSAKSGKPVQLNTEDVTKINDLLAKAKNGEEPALVNLIDHGHGHNWMHNNERGGFIAEVGAIMKDAAPNCVVEGNNPVTETHHHNKTEHHNKETEPHHGPIDTTAHTPSKFQTDIKAAVALQNEPAPDLKMDQVKMGPKNPSEIFAGLPTPVAPTGTLQSDGTYTITPTQDQTQHQPAPVPSKNQPLVDSPAPVMIDGVQVYQPLTKQQLKEAKTSQKQELQLLKGEEKIKKEQDKINGTSSQDGQPQKKSHAWLGGLMNGIAAGTSTFLILESGGVRGGYDGHEKWRERTLSYHPTPAPRPVIVTSRGTDSDRLVPLAKEGFMTGDTAGTIANANQYYAEGHAGQQPPSALFRHANDVAPLSTARAGNGLQQRH